MSGTAEAELRAAVRRIEGADPALARGLRAVRERGGAPAVEARTSRAAAPRDLLSPDAQLETIVLRVGRPVLAIVENRARLDLDDRDSEVWRERLDAAGDRLALAARAVGRINVLGHPQLQWVGTGWLVEERIIVTNRHVAKEFSRRSGERFTFRSFGDAPVRSSIDFLQEIDRDEALEFDLVDILHIESDDGPDVAFLRVEQTGGGSLARPIALAGRPAVAGQHVAVLGYPARDSRVPDFALMQSIFGDVYDRKRLAPGQVMDARADLVRHDCSTLGGNSGSVVLDLERGEAVALHYAGRFLKANSAVPAVVVADRLASLKRPGSSHVPPGPGPVAPDEAGEDDEDFVEARVEDYVGRRGYDPAFLGHDVPLPIVADAADVLTFPADGRTESTLQYQHFSVVMSRSRRLCLFSATNIDGGGVRRIKRAPWRLDPRIPKLAQIRDECYGNAPRFSRGHMTRRADPVWGEPADAMRANADSMHVTNTVPQLQPFNAGIWLGLEDYALDHAVQDAMRLCVFTGPFLLADDPVRYGVRIPRSFWKVIAFIHDETGALTATGYVMSQEALLSEEEFVFGAHETSQVAVRAIEQRTGLTFSGLAERDPLAEAEESIAVTLTDFRQIQLRRPA